MSEIGYTIIEPDGLRRDFCRTCWTGGLYDCAIYLEGQSCMNCGNDIAPAPDAVSVPIGALRIAVVAIGGLMDLAPILGPSEDLSVLEDARDTIRAELARVE